MAESGDNNIRVLERPESMERDPLSRARQRLVDEIRDDARRTAGYTGLAVFSDAVLAAIARVPRHEFVPDEARGHAYGNHPLAIGAGQTISQPFIVALMTELLAVGADSRVLELGTGSGYQAAVLAELVAEVCSIEIVASLAAEASARLARLGYTNVHVRAGDGTDGWLEAAPFDAIIVTAAGPSIPEALFGQLRSGGRLVIPVGGRYETQELRVATRDATGNIAVRDVLPVRFVPITGPFSD